jgi:hypothetical protein
MCVMKLMMGDGCVVWGLIGVDVLDVECRGLGGVEDLTSGAGGLRHHSGGAPFGRTCPVGLTWRRFRVNEVNTRRKKSSECNFFGALFLLARWLRR